MTTAAITEAITNEITLLGSAGCIRGIAKTLRAKALPYEVVRVDFKHYNSAWKGTKGLGLRVLKHVYYQLHENQPARKTKTKITK